MQIAVWMERNTLYEDIKEDTTDTTDITDTTDTTNTTDMLITTDVIVMNM